MKPGIYLHIPFCKSRCSYCDFATDVFRSADAVDRYVDAIIKEIGAFDNPFPDAKIETIYFGGGTPSLLSPRNLERVAAKLHDKFRIADSSEFTLEMNPATVSPEKLRDYREVGVNRASFGVQTFDDRALKLLARGHDSNDALKTLEMLRSAGFTNISFDLIGGLPNQSLLDWEQNLDKALSLEPEHLSLYLLEVHEATPLAEQIRTKRQPQPDEDLAAEMYEMMLTKVEAAGFIQYEISNFAKPGFESQHNSKYWLCDPVFAFGVSAHSFDGRRRWSNERDTNRYVELVESNLTPIVDSEIIDLASETAFLGLRLSRGLDLAAYQRRFGIDLAAKFSVEFERLFEAGLIVIENGFLKLTARGMVFSNEVFAVFV